MPSARHLVRSASLRSGSAASSAFGIFSFSAGTAAARYAGPAIMLSFVIGGIACAFVGLCYAELAALLPVAGSTYTYTYATLGEIFAWIIGWDLILEYVMGYQGPWWSAGRATSRQKVRNFGITIRFLGRRRRAPGRKSSCRMATTAWDAGRHSRGPYHPRADRALDRRHQGIGPAQQYYGRCKAVRRGRFVLLGAALQDLGQLATRLFRPIPATVRPLRLDRRGARLLSYFFAFIGFDRLDGYAGSAKLPQRDMPIGILGLLQICTILYVLVAAVVTGLVPYTELNVPDPIAKAVDVIGMTWFSVLIKIGALAGLTTVILVLLYGQSRVFFTIAKDGLLPKMFSEVHPTLGTPYKSQLLIGIVVAVVGAPTPIDVLGEMVSIGTYLAFVGLRRGGLSAQERCRDIPTVPHAGRAVGPDPRHRVLAIADGVSAWETWLRLIVWLAIGLAIYFAYGRSYLVLDERRTGAEG